jgi:hypothetical protein
MAVLKRRRLGRPVSASVSDRSISLPVEQRQLAVRGAQGVLALDQLGHVGPHAGGAARVPGLLLHPVEAPGARAHRERRLNRAARGAQAQLLVDLVVAEDVRELLPVAALLRAAPLDAPAPAGSGP